MRLDLSFSDFDEMLMNAAYDFLRRETPKLVIQDLLDTDTGCTPTIWEKAAEMGWLGIVIPEAYGGMESGMVSAGALFEALGTGPLPGPFFTSAILGSLIVLSAGSEEQKKAILPEMADGKMTLALALTEPDYRWEPEGIETQGKFSSGTCTLNGLKLHILDAAAASHFIVAVRTGKDKDAISLFLVDCQSAGVSIKRLSGFLSGRAFEVKLDNVSVPVSDMLGKKNKGWPLLKEAIMKATPVLCAYKVGGCKAAIDMALEYSRGRVQFGQPIGRFQRVQDMMIDMVNKTDGARWTTYEALWKLDTGQDADESVHLAKAVASDAYFDVCSLGHQVFSGLSYSMEHPLSFHTRASRHLYNYLGDPAYHRQQLLSHILD